MLTTTVSQGEFYSGHFGQTKLATAKFADLPKSFWPKWSDCFDMWKKIQSKFLQVNSVRPLWPLQNLKLAKIIFKSVENNNNNNNNNEVYFLNA